MIEHALTFAFGAISLALLMNLWSVVRGPSILDRVLVVDTMVINVIAVLILYGIWQGTAIYYEASMLVAMVGFVSTVAYCRFTLRGDIIE